MPTWAVVGTEDRVIPPDTQRHMAERAGATISEVAGSHVSMVSHPRASIDAILAAVPPSATETSSGSRAVGHAWWSASSFSTIAASRRRAPTPERSSFA